MSENDIQKIRVAANLPGLKDKIQINLAPGSDQVYWYIRFNIPLDPATVSQKTMAVTDTDGYIMRTEITYDPVRNVIIISPVDSYEQNVFYLLNITKKVKSAKGQHLQTMIHILFKLVNNQISEFKVLKSHVGVPLPKRRPPGYEIMRAGKPKVYTIDQALASLGPGKLISAPLLVNPIPGLLGIALVAGAYFTSFLYLWIGGGVLCVLGGALIFFQITRPAQRSALAYNAGVRHFNRERYRKAQSRFAKALALDEKNEAAEYALNKIAFYL